jgi:uncharacterized HAD superfamily protein
MAKELIAVDVDEVLFPFIDVFLEDYNLKYSLNLTKDQFHTYEFSGPLGLSVPETVDRIYSFQKTLGSSSVEPIETAREAIAQLASKFSLAVITARHSQFETLTTNWINEHFPNYFANISLVGFADIMEHPKTKAEVCIEFGASTLIDDSLYHLRQCAAVGIKGILFGDYPWNQTDELPEGIVRCSNWTNVLEHLEID